MTLFDKDTLGPYPALILLPTIQLDGVDRIHVEALSSVCVKESDYVNFLRRAV